MSVLRSLIVPGWTRFIPGLVVCIVFAVLTMNVDHLLGRYQTADLASKNLPGLSAQLAELEAAGDTDGAAAVVKKIDKHQAALEKVGGAVGDEWGWATFLYETAQFRYVAMLLVFGILIRNTVGVPKVFLPGIGIARPLIKPGIIILGVHYVWSDVLRVGGVGLLLASVFIFGTAITVMWISRRAGVSDGLGGIMGAGTGVCGVSAIIATAPVVGAKPRDMAYAIGTILLFGTVMLFVMPYLGTAIGLSQSEFGAWSALAILNTAQLIAAAEWFGEEARDTAVLINAARIMLIPLIVMFAVWFYGLKEKGKDLGFWATMRAKFPIFILGFFALILLNSLHLQIFGGPKIAHSPFWAMDSVYKWLFAIGFAGIGLSISIDDMRKAGGVAFLIGSGAAIAKMVLGLIVVMLLGAELLKVTGG
jgi:uncharacterized integral membrane protein (TIGR00698 family)